MVAPKNISTTKDKTDDKKSKSPSPEPFQEPDGMTTIDLNKSDDYSKESELEDAEIKKRAQIKYLAQLLFALGSIFVIVLLIIMMTFLNKEYPIFTVIPLKINESHNPETRAQTPLLAEKFWNITQIMNREKFREGIKSGKYIQQFRLEMDLCKIFKSSEFCCDIFRHSDLEELSKFCSVSDMLNYLIEYEVDSSEDGEDNDGYINLDISSNYTNNLNHDTNKTPDLDYKENVRNKRQISYDLPYENQHSYEYLSTPQELMHQQQHIDPFNDLNQYHPPDYQDQYLEAPHIPIQNEIKPTISTENMQEIVRPLIINKKYQLPENMISEIERSHHSTFQNLENNQDQPPRYKPETMEQLLNFDIGHWASEVNRKPEIQNFEPLLPNYNNNDDMKLLHNTFESRNSELNEDALTKTYDVFKLPAKFQRIMMPLPEHAQEDILHHVTVAPKLQHVYQSTDFQQDHHFSNGDIDNSDYEEFDSDDRGRLSEDDRRPTTDYKLQVDANGKFHIDSDRQLFNRNQGKFKNIDRTFIKNSNKSNKRINASNSPPQIISDQLQPSLDLNENKTSSQINVHSNLMVKNQKTDLPLGSVTTADIGPNAVLNLKVQDSKVKISGISENVARTYDPANMLGIPLDVDGNKNTSQIKVSPYLVTKSNKADLPLRSIGGPGLKHSVPTSDVQVSEIKNNQYSENVHLNDSSKNTLESGTDISRKFFESANNNPTNVTNINLVNSNTKSVLTTQQEDLRNITGNKNSAEIPILYTVGTDQKQITNNMTQEQRKSDKGTDESTILYIKNPFIQAYGSNLQVTDKSIYKIDNDDTEKDATFPKDNTQSNTSKDTKSNTKSQEILENARSNTAQDVFRGKQKQDSFTASEDLQTNQQTYINPCFNPYASPYIPFMPPTMPSNKVGSTQESGYLKVVSVSQPQLQNQPMYVLNPSMFYGVPPVPQSVYPSLTQNPFLPQVAQSPYGGSYSSPVQVTSPGGQYYVCNPIPTPTNNIAGISGVEVRRDAFNLQSLMENMEDFGKSNNSREADTLICPLGEQSCLDKGKCIKNHHICDSEVHCDDSSDEIGCSCKERVGKLRLCDGYCDCPSCEDEQGCFGCDADEYSCDDWSRFRRSTCVPISQRCDGIKQCEVTGKDEMDCSILTDHIGNFPLNKISNAVGFLHRNYKGKWYPTCFGTELWAAQVCQVEAGPSVIIPKAHMTLTRDPYNGLFVNILPNNKVSLVNTCVQDRAAFVECPPIYCGLRFLVNNPYRLHEIDVSIEDMLNDLERAYKLKEDEIMRSNTDSDIDIGRIKKESLLSFIGSDLDSYNNRSFVKGDFKESREPRSTDLRNKDKLHLEEVIDHLERTFRRREISKENKFGEILKESRVVGGKPSQPAAWPWLVSIYKNGIFHCGGVLINELWIVTASHCVDRYWQYYYEIQAGALRRFSYSPMDQRRWVTVIVPHEFYSKSNLRNDIALMKLSAPLRYNKYVRPICLPSESTAGQDFLKGPSRGTVCTTVGWGATVEHGADPDHMREVEVPILQHCKHKEDSDVQEICAGLTDGGKDACQGDSGGPLMCRNPNNPNQWYLAGIVSHGEGCARPNEPGVYTKVSRYMGWIAENTREEKFTMTIPLQKCPGYVCKGTKRCVPKKRRCDRIIDCLLGDDEINCEDDFRKIFKHSRKSVMPTNNNNPVQSAAADFRPNFEAFEEFDIVGSKSNDTTEEHKNQSSINIKTKNETEETSSITEKNIENKVIDKESQVTKEVQEVYFKCQMMLQVVSMNKLCNKIIDCEDGTDEFNCTCADYIKNVDPSAICDGVSDCYDLSDEKDCITCNENEYTCRLAKQCIDISKRCDGNSDCPHNEDELYCASLTNGHTISIDRDDRPMFKSRGIVTINHFGLWKPLCLDASSPFVHDEPSLATVICNLLGFDDYFSYHKYLVENGTINGSYSLKSGRILSEVENKKCRNCCEGLYISCSNTSTSTTLHYKSLEQIKELYISPWTAAIYSNGHYKCMGTLLDHYWIVTSVNCFLGITILQGKYIVAVFGRGKINISVKGPHEQIIRIVESITVNDTDILLLRLEQYVKFNRYVQAANLNVRRDGHQKEKCYAIGQDNDNKVRFVSLSPLKNCLVGYKCFEKKIEEPCNDIHSWSGTIICDSRSGWYPAAVFKEENGHCGFHHEKKYTSVKFYKNEILKIMTQTASPILQPHCDGLQCNLGNCISKEKICDGVVDCYSGEDENNFLCYEKEKDCYTADNCVCPQTHLKCPTTHKCFPKSSFCDRVNNCGEYEDEPEICSCRNYLKLTDPEKICDGVLHCLDRSDEDPNICTCTLDAFECGKTNKCISHEMVCDGVRDCPNGEDEATCLSLNTDSHDRTNAGEVMTRTAGIWHTGCFDLNYSTLQLEEICYNLGFSGGSATQLTPPHNITTLTTLRPVLDTFDVVWLRRQPGNKLKLRIRTGHDPYVKFLPDKRCHRLFIACI